MPIRKGLDLIERLPDTEALAAREHGEREYLEIPVRVGKDRFALERRGAKEIGRIEVRFAPAAMNAHSQ